MARRPHSKVRYAATAAAGTLVATTLAVGFGSQPATAGAEVDCAPVLAKGLSLEQQFDAAAKASGVPSSVLKAVSYNQSRWEDHGSAASADGGYGPMHLTDLAAATDRPVTNHPGTGKGDGSVREAESEQRVQSAARLTGLSAQRLRTDAAANICGGAAVLASYGPAGTSAPGAWAEAVARYGSVAEGSSKIFANQVYSTLRAGEKRTTSAGERVVLPARDGVRVPYPKTASATDCPAKLDCEWIEAPYAKENPDDPDNTTAYGNHDLADRTGKGGPSLDYILIHNTEGSYDGSIAMVQDPTYLAWNYTLRSTDGHVAQHLDAKDVGWHAGNWYLNMHSIGLEHEGKAGNGGWFTESMMRSSAALVKYLTKKYDIPLDRGHVIGHDQVPGTTPGTTSGVHWDPGPYWDWQHYFELLGKPVAGNKKPTARIKSGDVVTVKPGFRDNPHPLITDCEAQSPGSGACVPGAGTNFVTLYQEPNTRAALATDIGEHPDGSASTWRVDDYSARATAGQRLVVGQVRGDWVQVWWAGKRAWIENPRKDPVLAKAKGKHKTQVVTAAASDAAPVYGRAYPEKSAYPADVPYQELAPLEYTIKPGQKYVVLDDDVATDYYYSKSFDGSIPGDRTNVEGEDEYLQIELAHRTFFVRAEDVKVSKVR